MHCSIVPTRPIQAILIHSKPPSPLRDGSYGDTSSKGHIIQWMHCTRKNVRGHISWGWINLAPTILYYHFTRQHCFIVCWIFPKLGFFFGLSLYIIILTGRQLYRAYISVRGLDGCAAPPFLCVNESQIRVHAAHGRVAQPNRILQYIFHSILLN